MNAIIIDKNELTQKMYSDLLTPYVENLVVAYSGQMALRLLAQNDYDFIFIDHFLPDCLGSDIIFQAKKQHRGSKFISISSSTDVTYGYKRLGYDDVLQPPFNENILRLLIQN